MSAKGDTDRFLDVITTCEEFLQHQAADDWAPDGAPAEYLRHAAYRRERAERLLAQVKKVRELPAERNDPHLREALEFAFWVGLETGGSYADAIVAGSMAVPIEFGVRKRRMERSFGRKGAARSAEAKRVALDELLADVATVEQKHPEWSETAVAGHLLRRQPGHPLDPAPSDSDKAWRARLHCDRVPSSTYDKRCRDSLRGRIRTAKGKK